MAGDAKDNVKSTDNPLDSAADSIKSAAGDAKVSAQSATGGGSVSSAVDTAKSAAGEAKSTTESATGGNPVDKAVDTAKSATSEVKSNTDGGAGGNPLEQAADAAKSAAGDAGKPNFFQNFLGIDSKQGGKLMLTYSPHLCKCKQYC